MEILSFMDLKRKPFKKPCRQHIVDNTKENVSTRWWMNMTVDMVVRNLTLQHFKIEINMLNLNVMLYIVFHNQIFHILEELISRLPRILVAWITKPLYKVLNTVLSHSVCDQFINVIKQFARVILQRNWMSRRVCSTRRVRIVRVNRTLTS